MKYLFTYLTLFFISSSAFAQDTVWVETLNFNDITKRKGTYQFPASGQNWQKINMHYTLKCDPQTTQDGFPCGEWDYLSYSTVHDSTGQIDSTERQHSNFRVGDSEPDDYGWVITSLADTLYRYVKHRVVDVVASKDSVIVGSGLSSSNDVFNNTRVQYIYTAQELNTLGLSAGIITSLTFLSKPGSMNVNNVNIGIAATVTTNLDRFIETPFNTVFEGNIQGTGGTKHEFSLLEPFVWDGTSNLVIEFLAPTNAGLFPSLATDVTPNAGVLAGTQDAYYEPIEDGFISINDAQTVCAPIDSVITVAFWAKGDAALPSNTSIIEGKNVDGQRVINIHHPWSNGQIYWDAGNDGGSYDRINKAASNSQFKDKWNHYAFVKNAKTGSMKVYINGSLWHSGNDKFRNMAGITEFRIGKGITNYQYQGKIDQVVVFNSEVSASSVALLSSKKLDPSHPDFSNLVFSFDFDNYDQSKASEIISNHAPSIKASIHGNFYLNKRTKKDALMIDKTSGDRPMAIFAIANQTDHVDSSLISVIIERPRVSIAKFEDQANPTIVSSFSGGWKSGLVYSFNPDGTKRDSTNIAATNSITKSLTTYYTKFEVVENIEIARYITPYGINFDLGPNGFKWVYDVTDYAHLLTDRVTLSSGNQQELIDLRFEFIKGTPPRDVKEISYYINRENKNFKSIAEDVSFQNQSLAIHPGAETFKLKTRITGHGHNADEGKNHCCEWADKTHYLEVNGKAAFDWSIWQDDKCAMSPLIDQGGNWAPPRAGWCPGATVDDYDFNLTPLITGDSVQLNYNIEPVPTDNLGQGGGNYVVSMHLMQYGHYNFANDVEVLDIIRPNNWEFYRRLNPTCGEPQVKIRNTGSEEVVGVLLKYGVVGGNPIQFYWTGQLQSEESAVIDLPFAMWDYVSSVRPLKFFAEVVTVNGKKDEYAGNDRASVPFDVPKTAPTSFDLWYRNNSLEDATLVIKDRNGKVVYEKLDGKSGALNKETLNLDPGCYSLICETENGFGLYYPLIPQVGSGLLRLSAPSAGFIENFNPDFGKRIEYFFTVGYSLQTEPLLSKTWSVYPNPSQGLF
ncbi:MAG: hypothetical protein ACI8ZN_001072, partial [Bacteroidia bacterium]